MEDGDACQYATIWSTKLIKITFKNLVPTSKKTQRDSITKIIDNVV
jgi:phosphopantothenate synthetase